MNLVNNRDTVVGSVTHSVCLRDFNFGDMKHHCLLDATSEDGQLAYVGSKDSQHVFQEGLFA